MTKEYLGYDHKPLTEKQYRQAPHKKGAAWAKKLQKENRKGVKEGELTKKECKQWLLDMRKGRSPQ